MHLSCDILSVCTDWPKLQNLVIGYHGVKQNRKNILADLETFNLTKFVY